MRKGWEYKKLGEVATFINGDRGKNYPSAKDFVESGVPFINAGHLNNGIINYDKMNYITINKYNSLGSGKIIKNDILFCLRGSLGKYAIVDGDSLGAIASSLVIIRPFQNADNRFIAHFLSTAKFKEYIIKNNNGSSQPNLSAKSVASFIIPLPPKSTQFSIVSELDKINELIRLKKEQLKDFDNLAQSIFYEMFGDPVENERGWEVKKLGDVCTDITDGDHMPPPKSDFGIPFITISDIDKETRCLNFENTFYVLEDYYNNLKENRKPQKGDLLYTVTGSYGIPVIVKTDKKFCFQRHIALLRPNNEILSIFLCYWMQSDGVKFMADKVATGIAQKTIGLKSIRKFSCILPPLPLQNLFAQRIEQIEHQKAEVQKSITDFETLLASRMQYWFE